MSVAKRKNVRKGIKLMEWIETTGSTVDEAKDRALDRLGVPEDDLDYEVLAEPTSALFGLRKTDARLRARVRPRSLNFKNQPRNRNNKQSSKNNFSNNKNQRKSNKNSKSLNEVSNASENKSNNAKNQNKSKKPKKAGNTKGPVGKNENKQTGSSSNPGRNQQKKTKTEEKGMDLKTQAEITEKFVRGLLEHMQLDARVVSSVTEERVLVEAQGLNLGLAIGKRGETVRAITQLSRTMIQRMSGGKAEGSLIVDVGGYRERRRSFLAEFTLNQANEVLEDGHPRALDSMNAADRKVVHDTVAEIHGVKTQSQGSDMDRHVVILIDSEE